MTKMPLKACGRYKLIYPSQQPPYPLPLVQEIREAMAILHPATWALSTFPLFPAKTFYLYYIYLFYLFL